MNNKQLVAVIWEKSWFNLKSEAAQNYLSYTWWFLEPIIHMVCYYAVFELLLERGGPGFVHFLLVGLVPWLWFARVLTQGSVSLINGNQLMNQLYIPKLFFPLVFVVQTTVKQLLVVSVLLVFLLISGFELSIHWLGLIPIFLIQLLFISPMAALAAVLVVYIKDFKIIIPTIIQFLFFCSGIFFSFERISSEYKDYFFINPMAGLIAAYRNVLIDSAWPDWNYLFKVFVASMVLMAIILLLYKKNDYVISKLAQE